MITRKKFVPITEHMREMIEDQERDFPFVAMDDQLQEYPNGETPWHWHDYFEFCRACEGSFELCTRSQTLKIRAGEGYFVNANVLHRSRVISEGSVVHQHVMLFSRSLVAGTGLAGRKYIAPLENNPAMEALRLTPDTPREKEILDALESSFQAAEAGNDGHEMRICAHLGIAWASLYNVAKEKIGEGRAGGKEDAAAMKAMLGYIQEHYQEDVSVGQIAAAAGVCERECYRRFSRMLDTTPMQYLTRRRIDVSARALAETDAPVAQIAADCGFSSASYFIRVFRHHMGVTPLEFRRREKRVFLPAPP